jgi:hypothetical protein
MKSAPGTKHRARLELAKFNGEWKIINVLWESKPRYLARLWPRSALVKQRFHLAIVIPTQSVLREACAKK